MIAATLIDKQVCKARRRRALMPRSEPMRTSPVAYFLRLAAVSQVLAVTASVWANNLQISNSLLWDADPTDGIAMVQFDIGWENSWRVSTAPNNWDAAWVFLKFRVGATDPIFTAVSSVDNILTVNSTSDLRVGMPVRVLAGTGTLAPWTVVTSIVSATTFTVDSWPGVALSGATVLCERIWEHCLLGNTAAHIAPSGSTITVGSPNAFLPYSATNPGVGVFIHRSVDGNGSFFAPGCQLQWLHGSQGVTIGMAVDICVHAVEMVLIPTGSYYLGGAGAWAFRAGNSGSTPRLITSENYLNYATTFSPTLSYGGLGNGNDFSSAFPKGYEGFYCMKYELSQNEYVAFLNKLTRFQQTPMVATNIAIGVTAITNRYVMTNTATMMDRSAIRCPATIDPALAITFVCDADGDGTPDEADDGGWTSANHLTTRNMLAYLDWSGLRLMSEMEYEKACRGPGVPVAGDLAWGGNSTTLVLPTTQTGLYTASESVEAGANGCYSSLAPSGGPFRGGMFAEAGANRVTAGASYYGVMDLSGNLAECAISAGYLSLFYTRAFHGDGRLTFPGNHDVPQWPPNGEYCTARGGSWSMNVAFQRVSDRSLLFVNTTRYADRGFRGVRRAP